VTIGHEANPLRDTRDRRITRIAGPSALASAHLPSVFNGAATAGMADTSKAAPNPNAKRLPFLPILFIFLSFTSVLTFSVLFLRNSLVCIIS